MASTYDRRVSGCNPFALLTLCTYVNFERGRTLVYVSQ